MISLFLGTSSKTTTPSTTLNTATLPKGIYCIAKYTNKNYIHISYKVDILL